MTAVDNSTGAEVPEPCNAAPCLAVFGVLLKVWGQRWPAAWRPRACAETHAWFSACALCQRNGCPPSCCSTTLMCMLLARPISTPSSPMCPTPWGQR